MLTVLAILLNEHMDATLGYFYSSHNNTAYGIINFKYQSWKYQINLVNGLLSTALT